MASAEALADERGEAYWRPELARLRGEFLLLRDAGATDEAERCFRDALERARSQNARSLGLRAAMNLARLARQRGDAGGTKELLSPMLASFTEGFDMADLREARKLLEEG